MKKILLGLYIILALVAIAAPAHAATTCSAKVQQDLGAVSSAFGNHYCSPSALILAIIKWILGILGLLAILMVVYGGFLYITAGVNESNAKKGRSVLTNAIIGLVIALLAYTIVAVTANLVNGGINSGSSAVTTPPDTSGSSNGTDSGSSVPTCQPREPQPCQ